MQKILIADDNDVNLYYLQSLLSAAGYEVVSAKNGAEALESALANPPDLILSDILMPVMDGFALCQRWRGEKRLARIPFAFYTATYTDPRDKELGLRIGADEFLMKPVEPDALLETIRDLLRRKETGELPDRPRVGRETDVILREYNAALVRKLEDKLVELEVANQKLTNAEAFSRAVLDNSPLPIVVLDPEGRVLLTNPAFSATFGYSAEEATGKVCSNLIDPPEKDSETALAGARPSADAPPSSKRRRKDGVLIEVEVFQAPIKLHGEVKGLLAIYRDITEQRKIEEQLRQAQKLEAVGQLAAGVAHDFNNLLGLIVCYSELISDSVEPHGRLRHYADQIGDACERASALTRQLLVFSRRQVLLPRLIDLEIFMEEMSAMVRRLTREDIELSVDLKKPIGKILIDPMQFEQVVLNLVTNACDAMPNGGTLGIALCDADIKEGARNPVNLRPGEYVKLAVTDSGLGMDEATVARIFEPFFTTKPVGTGTGLGLASVHGIVEQSGGAVQVHSLPGKGTSFEIFFPRAHAGSAQASDLAEPPLQGGSETILVAEDAETLRTLIDEMLTGLGYRVLAAGSAEDAARTLRDPQEHIDLLVTDLIMPKMSGRELSELGWAVRPKLQVLYISGYEPDQIQDWLDLPHRAHFLPKPFTRRQLAAAVRKKLDTTGSAPK